MVLWELLTWELPWRDTSPWQVGGAVVVVRWWWCGGGGACRLFPLLFATAISLACSTPPLQIANNVMGGRRPPIPPASSLPGGVKDGSTLLGLDSYIALMQR
jgi:hypothetical protein